MASAATGSIVTRVNAYTTGAQTSASLSVLADGGWLVAWSGEGTGDSAGAFYRRYSKTGEEVGSDILVNQTTDGTQGSPAVAVLKDGAFVFSWTGAVQGDENGDGYTYFNTGGIALSDVRVNSHTTDNQARTDITALTGGGWVVTWYGAGADDASGIYQQRYDSNRVAQGTQTAINTTLTGVQATSDIAALASGGWVVTWRGQGDGDTFGIFQQRYSSEGMAQGTQSAINTHTDGNQSNPSVSSLKDGGWIVAWNGAGDDDESGVYFQRFDEDGVKVKGETIVNTTITGDCDDPIVRGLADGGWVVVWEGATEDDPTGVFQQRFNSKGKAVGTETLVNTYTPGVQAAPDVVAFKDGGWLVTWQGEGESDLSGIYQRRFAADILGGNAKDTLKGTAFDELLSGGRGNDQMTGGKGSDHFVYSTGFDRDLIKDFDAKGGDHDILDLSGLKSVKNYSDLKKNHMDPVKGDIVIDGGHGDVIVLDGVKMKDVDPGDFAF